MNSTTVLSTGQTLDDILGLAAIAQLSEATTGRTIELIPPALTNPNYVAPINWRYCNTTISTVVSGLCTVLVVWKIHATQKNRTRKLFFIEDWLLLLALSCAYIYTIVTYKMYVEYQGGWHVYDLRLRSLLGYYKYMGVTKLLLIFIFLTSRASLVLSLRRIYSPLKTRMVLYCDVLVMFKIMALIIAIVILVFKTPKHPETLTNLYAALKYDRNSFQGELSILFLAIVIDLLILLSPLPLINKLKRLPKNRRRQMIWMVLFGLSTITVAAVRIAIYIRREADILVDITWWGSILTVLNCWETFLSIVTASLPTANIFFRWAYAKENFPSASLRPTNPKKVKRSRLLNTVSTVNTTCTTDTDGKFDMESIMEDVPHPAIEMEDRSNDRQEQLPMSKTKEQPKVSVTEHEKTFDVGPSDQTYTFRDDCSNVHHDGQLSGADSILPLYEHSQSATFSVTSFTRLPDIEDADDEDNFYEMLVPSDSFFPWHTALSPRPSATQHSEGIVLKRI